MANALTDIGSPVEARMSLARIGVSFKNAYDSDEVWAKTNTIVPDWEYQGKEAFQPAKAKAESRITPQLFLKALESGVFNEPNPLKYTPYFSKVAIKPIEVHGAQFWLVDGDNFNYPAFRATVLQEAIDHYYKIPAWLPKGGCPFCERYNGPAMCLATPQS